MGLLNKKCIFTSMYYKNLAYPNLFGKNVNFLEPIISIATF
jgi:hypothetical protein